VKTLGQLGNVMELLKDQYRHCKTILALGGSGNLLDAAGIWKKLESGDDDPGVLHFEEGTVTKPIAAFAEALGKHRHFERETLPPRI